MKTGCRAVTRSCYRSRAYQCGLTLIELLTALALSGLVASALLGSVGWLSDIHNMQSERITAWERELLVRQTWQRAFRRLRLGLPWAIFECDTERSEQADALLGLPHMSTLSVVGAGDDGAPSRAVADSDVISIRHYGCGGYFTEQYYVGRNARGDGEESRGLYYRERWQEERWSYSQEVLLGLTRMQLRRCDQSCLPGQEVSGFQSVRGVRMAFHWHETSALPFAVSYLTLPVSNMRALPGQPEDTSELGADN